MPTDLPPGLPDRFYAAPSVAAVRASGLPLVSPTPMPQPPAAPFVMPPPTLAERAALLTQRAVGGIQSLLGIKPAATPAPTEPAVVEPTPAPPAENNYYKARVATSQPSY